MTTAQALSTGQTVIGAITPAAASTNVIVPGNLAATEGDGLSNYPFGAPQARFQQVYSASQFPTTETISAIDFRRDGSQAPFTYDADADVQIDLAYSATRVGSVSSTFASNVGGGDITVFSGTLDLASAGSGSPNPFDVSIPLAKDFTYNPALGDLLMDVRVFQGPNNAIFLDAADGSQQTVTSRIVSIGNVGATTGTINANGGTGLANSYGLVTQFAVSPTPLSQDWYATNVTSTTNGLAYETSTPGAGAGAFGNTLNPHLQLFDPNGNLVATGSKLPDGINEILTYQPLTTGKYYIQVTSQASTAGEYVLMAGTALTLNLPANVTEGQGTVTGSLAATTAPSSDLTVTLASSDPTRISVPATVVLPAGQTSVNVPLTVVDDNLLNGPEAISITASGGSYFSANSTVTIHDNETATLGVSLPAGIAKNGGAATGTVTSSAPPTQNIVVQLVSSNPAKLIVPATATILAGQTTATFTMTPVDNKVIDGNQNVTVTATFENWTTGSATTSVIDTDNTIAVSLPPSGFEGQTFTNAGTITLGGTSSSDITVNLLSSNPSDMNIPATVTVPAGQTSATFTIGLLSDNVKQGTRTDTVTGSATGLVTGSANIAVHDSTLDHLVIAKITRPQTAGTAFAVTAQACNIANEVIPVYAGSATLSAAGLAGVEPVSPTSLNFAAGVATGGVTLTVADSAAVLTFTTGGVSASSNAFVVRAAGVSSLAWGAVSTPQTENLPFNASLTAYDTYGNIATGFNGTVNLTTLFNQTVSESGFGNISPSNYAGGGTYTVGYSFTPNINMLVTAVRSYFGNRVSIWTNTGTLLASQSLSGSVQTWLTGQLSTPIALQAGVTYRIGAYTNGQASYYGSNMSANVPYGVINAGYEIPGAAFPTISDGIQWWFVDLVATFLAPAPVPMTPTTATFTNGVWNGNISVTQPTLAVRLHADDGNGHTADSSTFDVLEKTTSVILPANVREGDGIVDGLVSTNLIATSPVTVTLTSSDPTRVSVPATVTIPVGQSSANIPLTVIDDNLLNGPELITISASTPTFTPASAQVTIHDNESATLSLTLPASAAEGVGAVTGTVNSSTAPTQNITITLASSNTARASVPATVILPAGQTSVNFPISVINDNIANGTTLVSISAAAENWIEGFGTLAILDNDNTLKVTVPGSGWEGQTFTNAGTVTIGGADASDVIVNLAASVPGDVTLPANVTIPAGQTSATFSFTLNSDNLTQGTRVDAITATAAGFTIGTANLVDHDSTVDYLAFNPLATPQTAAVPFATTLNAYNASNEVITVDNSPVTLSGISSGNGVPITPTSAVFTAGAWTGNVTVNAVNSAVQLQAVSSGVTGLSNTFAVQPGAVASFQWGPVATPQVQNAPFAVTLTALDANGFTANFNGTVNLSALSGTTAIPITPNTAAFANGVWSGNISVTQPAASLHLHLDDGAGHTADSATFDVNAPPPLPTYITSSSNAVYQWNPNTANLTLDAGSLTFTQDQATSGNTVIAPLNLTVTGPTASVFFNSTQHLAGLTLANGASATITEQSDTSTLTTNTFSIDPTSSLDVTNNIVLINYSAAGQTSPDAAVRTALVTGSGAGGTAFNGVGIYSSTAARLNAALVASDRASAYTVGYEDGSDPTLNGEGPASGVEEIRFTLVGDLNLDGSVNSADFILFADNFGKVAPSYDRGDLNYDNNVNSADFILFSNNFGQNLGNVSATSGGAPISSAMVSNKNSTTPGSSTPVAASPNRATTPSPAETPSPSAVTPPPSSVTTKPSAMATPPSAATTAVAASKNSANPGKTSIALKPKVIANPIVAAIAPQPATQSTRPQLQSTPPLLPNSTVLATPLLKSARPTAGLPTSADTPVASSTTGLNAAAPIKKETKAAPTSPASLKKTAAAVYPDTVSSSPFSTMAVAASWLAADSLGVEDDTSC
jgi:hypothetical protein